MDKLNTMEFPVFIYGTPEKFNDVLSKARCRIFYKYENRNGTYITDEFAEELLSTLSYAPIKGIYDDTEDFSDHGESNDQGRIYGIVPENPNITWESHIDVDGISREYACADVLLFTALYKEANEICGKAQSMELYQPTLLYHTELINGQKYVVFDHGSFFGLQVLGDNVEPCFEGAAFFALKNTIEEIQKYMKEGGKSEMPKLNYAMSDREKYDMLWEMMNSNYNEENNYAIDYEICDVYDDYVIAYACGRRQFVKVCYEKDCESDKVCLGEMTDVYQVFVCEEEKKVLDTLHELNGGSYKCVKPELASAEENAKKCGECELKINELTEANATLTTEVSETQEKYTALESQYAEAQSSIETLTSENESLKEFKLDIEKQQKLSVIDSYSDLLATEVLDSFREKVDEFTSLDLDKELAYELKNSNRSIFSKQAVKPEAIVPKEVTSDGIEDILSRYENK